MVAFYVLAMTNIILALLDHVVLVCGSNIIFVIVTAFFIRIVTQLW